jgi:ribosomal protein L11 methyltransferase
MNWIEINIYTTSEGIEPVSGRLYQLGITGLQIEDAQEFRDFIDKNEPFWDYIDDELISMKNSETYIKLYVSDNDHGNETLLAIRDSIKTLRELDTEGKFGRLEFEMANVSEEDWANNWKQYFKPFKIGEKVIIKPSWEDYNESTDRIVFNIDPGMLFGTGTHESTRLCIEAGERYIRKDDSVLDLGCGSGILSIISLMLGAQNAVAVDIDLNVTEIASANAQMNGISKDRYTVLAGNAISDENIKSQIGYKKYHVVYANIVADVIIALSTIIPAQIKPGGILISSGIIDERADEVASALKDNGFEILEMNKDNCWVGLVCRKSEEDA